MAYPNRGYATSFYTYTHTFIRSISHSIYLRKRYFHTFLHNFNTTSNECGVFWLLVALTVRKSSLLRTLLSISGEKRGVFCLKIIFYFFSLLFYLSQLQNRLFASVHKLLYQVVLLDLTDIPFLLHKLKYHVLL